MYIKTEQFSSRLRSQAINLKNKTILITNFNNSEQSKDIQEPINCNGFGRIRRFKLKKDKNWMQNPLPIFPASKALNIESKEIMRTQVFQNAICNWRCWYCFVDFSLLSANKNKSSYLSCDNLIELYLKQNDPPIIIDLTGGQPDLTPEWVPWMMETLINKNLHEKIFLWSDDNLSNDYFWRYLNYEQIELIKNYKMYSRVCCFKGFDEESFSLNTKAEPKYFQKQLEYCKRLLTLGIDLYFYITLTAKTNTNFTKNIPIFLDKIQKINELLPLRIVPLEIKMYTPVDSRITDELKDMIKGQYIALDIWKSELQKRFTNIQLNEKITEIKLN